MAGDGVRNPSDTTDIEEQLDDIEDRLILIDADLIIIDNEVGQIHTVVNAIQVMTDSLPILTETGGTVTTDGTEQNVYINATPDGVYKPICVTINCTAQTAGETIIVRLYYDNALGGAGLILVDELEFIGLISPEMLVIDLDPNRYGIAVTIERTAGNARAYVWDVVYEATP